jgi:exoribonuclease II
MNVFFEEDGGFKVARVMEDIGTSLQVEAASGKRSKIKSNVILLRFESALSDLLPQAEALAGDIDPDFLYEVSGDAEFAFDDLALDYYGHKPSAAEAASCAIKLHSAPMYFYKRGKGRYQKAPAENLKAALASIERKKREADEMAAWVDALSQGVMPDAMRPHVNQLLYKPDRNTLIAKACEKAVVDTGTPLPQLFFAAGAWGNRDAAPHMAQHDYHVGKFLADYFPRGVSPTIDIDFITPADLPIANVAAYSIDDAATTEIDDAFSCRDLGDGNIEIGVHIAAPALFIAEDSALDAYAKSRLSTVYYPGHKITMLPEAAVAAATLAAGQSVPSVSLYATFCLETRTLTGVRSIIERVPIAENLRLNVLEKWFTPEAITNQTHEGAFGKELLTLHAIALALKEKRGAKDSADYVDYNFDIADDGAKIDISARVRGSPVDTVVAEFMIFANSEWGKLLAENNVAAIYRVQQNMKTRMTTDALPHEGLGVAYYAWSSSPLRRYVDLVNQRQLIALIQGETPRYPRRSPVLNETARTFDVTYDAYAEFQRNMERFWCLRYLSQQGETTFAATIIRDELVRGSHLPLIVRLNKSPNLPGKTPVIVHIGAIDYWAIGGEFSIDESLHITKPPEAMKAA